MLSKELLEKMSQYEWSGNVRELKNVVERLVLTWSVGSTEIKQIPEEMYGNPTMINEDHDNPKSLENHLSEIPIDFSSAEFSLKGYMEQCEKDVLMKALQETGSTYKAAELLKVNQSTVFRKKQMYGL